MSFAVYRDLVADALFVEARAGARVADLALRVVAFVARDGVFLATRDGVFLVVFADFAGLNARWSSGAR